MKHTLTAYECDNPSCKKMATTLKDDTRLPYGWCHISIKSQTYFDCQQREPRMDGDFYVCSRQCATSLLDEYVKAAFGTGVLPSATGGAA